jgi:hypothetical protein
LLQALLQITNGAGTCVPWESASGVDAGTAP